MTRWHELNIGWRRGCRRIAIVCVAVGSTVGLLGMLNVPFRYQFLSEFTAANQKHTENRGETVDLLELTADFEDVRRGAADELLSKGFQRGAETREPEMRMVGFRSGNPSRTVNLLWTKDRPSTVLVSTWEGHRDGAMDFFLKTLSRLVFCVISIRPDTQCRMNLLEIEGAKYNWAMEQRNDHQAMPRDTDLFGANGYIRVRPDCPMGGFYWFGPVKESPRCSVPGHSPRRAAAAGRE